MPSLNGVHIGDVWRNLHTGNEFAVAEIRLGGRGTYTDREPVIVWDDRHFGIGGETMWGLAEHWEPVTRPGEWPVPWKKDRRFGRDGRSAHEAWRTPGIRGLKRRRSKYFHTYLEMDGEYSSKGWNWWQVDPAAEEKQQKIDNALAFALELIESEDPLIRKVGENVLATFAEAA
jgi:hypothetical protein